jgi:hypothetical protein
MIGLALFIKPFVYFLNPVFHHLIPEILFFALSIIPFIFIQFFAMLFISVNDYVVFILALVLVVLSSIALVLWGHHLRLFISIRMIAGFLMLAFFVVYFFLKRRSLLKTWGPPLEA